MGLIAEDKGGNFQAAEGGTQIARCIGLIDLGTQKTFFQGKEIGQAYQILLYFELPNDTIKEGERAGEPLVVSRFYTMSLNKKANLRKDLEAWRGKAFTPAEIEKGFDVKQIVGKPCMLTISHDEQKDKSYIKGITAVVKGMQIPKQINPSKIFDLSNFDKGMFDSMSGKMQDIISQSKEYKEMSMAQSEETSEEDVPFMTKDELEAQMYDDYPNEPTGA